MNKVTSKNCSLKGTADNCGTHEVTVEHSVECNKIDKTTVPKKSNINGLVNGLVEEKPSIIKKVNKKDKKIVKHNSNKSKNANSEIAVNDDKIIAAENSNEKHIVDSSINVKNNRKINKNSKNSKTNLNDSRVHPGSAVKKNSINVTHNTGEDARKNEHSVVYKESTPSSSIENDQSDLQEIVPKSTSRTSKRDKCKKTDLINNSDKQLNLELDDFDITSIITNKKVDLSKKTPQQPKLKDEPTCSTSTENVINIDSVSDVMEKLVLKEESLSTNRNEDEKPEDVKKEQQQDLPPIDYVQYESELQMPMIMKIIQKDLSEPYSIYTYRYFIHNWPNLCFLAMCEELCVGAIVCKLDIHRKEIKRGYIAMLAVDKNYRNRGIGSTLVRRAIQEMITGDADEVVLETEITNKPALRLYEALGFVRDKRLFRYYLNGVDALRLKLWLR